MARYNAEKLSGKTFELRLPHRRNHVAVDVDDEWRSLRPDIRSARFRMPAEANELPAAGKDLERMQLARPDNTIGAVDANALGR